MTASALSLAQTPLYDEKWVFAIGAIAVMMQNIKKNYFPHFYNIVISAAKLLKV